MKSLIGWIKLRLLLLSFSGTNDRMCSALFCCVWRTVLTFSISHRNVSADYHICHLLTIHLKDVGLIRFFIAIGMTRVIAHVNSCYLGDVERVIFSKILWTTKRQERVITWKTCFKCWKRLSWQVGSFWQFLGFQWARSLTSVFWYSGWVSGMECKVNTCRYTNENAIEK